MISCAYLCIFALLGAASKVVMERLQNSVHHFL